MKRKLEDKTEAFGKAITDELKRRLLAKRIRESPVRALEKHFRVHEVRKVA